MFALLATNWFLKNYHENGSDVMANEWPRHENLPLRANLLTQKTR